MIRIALIGCGKKKRAGTHRARWLYTGALFTKALAYAERDFIDIFVLSAKHGLVELDDELDDYDRRMPTARADKEAWAEAVAQALRARYVDCALELTMLAGASYIQPLRDATRIRGDKWSFHCPLSGLQVGQRLRWFNMVAPPPRGLCGTDRIRNGCTLPFAHERPCV
jgi:hypothetical protein